MTLRLMILNGPNLNLLGVREPHIYGTTTLAIIEASCQRFATVLCASLSFHQSNHEGALVDLIQQARTTADAIVINPAAHLDFEMMQPVGTNARSQRLRQPVVETLLRGNVFVKEGIGEAHRLTERDLTKRLFGEKVGRRLAGQTRMQFTQAHADLV